MAVGDWLRRVTGGRPSGRLAALLATYPPYAIPHPGLGRALSLAQADANLAYLVTHREERLAAIGTLLSECGVDMTGAYGPGDPGPFLDRVWDWIKAEWPAIHDPVLARRDKWLNSRRTGKEIVYSLVMDVAILSGEVVLSRRPDFGWALDLDPQNEGDEDGMVSQRRPCVIRPADDVVPAILYDPEDQVQGAYAYCTSATYFWLNHLRQGVMDMIDGAHERRWREEAAARP